MGAENQVSLIWIYCICLYDVIVDIGYSLYLYQVFLPSFVMAIFRNFPIYAAARTVVFKDISALTRPTVTQNLPINE